MTLEEALEIITAALAPKVLNELQMNVFRGAFLKHSYIKMSRSLNYKEAYIKDIGAELWRLLTDALATKVTKLSLREALLQYVQQRQMRDLPALPTSKRVDWGEAPPSRAVLWTTDAVS